jgi:hypothetical protein
MGTTKSNSSRRGLLIIALMMDVASISETSVKFYQTARHSFPGDSHLHTHRCGNLKYHFLEIIYEGKSESKFPFLREWR